MHKTTSLHTCKNCDAPVDGNYCAACGQKSTVSKITITETFQEIINMFFSVNTPLLVTLKYLCSNPGKLFREYIQGKRKTYYKPVPFFILMTVFYVIMSSFFNTEFLKSEMINNELQNTEALLNRAGQFMQRNVTNFLFLFVFSIGISLKLLFRKRYSLAEYLTIAFYLVGIYTLMTSCFMYFINKLPLSLRSIPFLFMMVYFMYAIISFFKQRHIKIFMKGIIAYFIAVFLFMFLSFGLSVLIVFLYN